MATQVRHNLEIVRGDTFDGLELTLTDGNSPAAAISVASAECSIRKSGGQLLHEFSPTVTGAGSNVVQIGSMTTAETQAMPTGSHMYDVEFTLTDGRVKTWLFGAFIVSGDVS